MSAAKPEHFQETALRAYKCMTRLNTMDKILYDRQRQARKFFMNKFLDQQKQMEVRGPGDLTVIRWNPETSKHHCEFGPDLTVAPSDQDGWLSPTNP